MPAVAASSSTRRKPNRSTIPRMPDDNDAYESRQKEEYTDHEEKKSELDIVAIKKAQEQKRAEMDEKALRRSRGIATRIEAVREQVHSIGVELQNLFPLQRSHVVEDIQSLECRIEHLLEVAWGNSSQRKVMEELEGRAERVQVALDSVPRDIYGMQMRREKVTKDAQGRLKRLMEHDDHLKLSGYHDKHRQKCVQFADGSIALAKHLSRTKLQEMEINYIKAGIWQPRSAETGHSYSIKDASKWHSFGALLSEHQDLQKDRIAIIFKRMAMLHNEFNPAGEEVHPARASREHPIRFIGHEIRAIELECTRYRIFPGITFARTWATICQSKYISTWKMDLDELKKWLRVEKTSHYRPWYTNILREVQRFVYRVEDTSRDYKQLISEGDSLLCPHRHREFHEWHVKTFTGFQTNRFDYLHLQAMVDTLITDLHNISISVSKTAMKARHRLLHSLEESLGPQMQWRREYRQSSEKLMATLSVGYLLSGKPMAPHNPGIAPWKAFSHIDRTQRTKSSLTHWNPDKWLDRSLLPSPSNIPIDYVACSQTLYAILPELHESKILGIDIIRAPGPGNPSHKLEYLLLANETQIVIIDFQAIDSRHVIDAIGGLRYILEHKKILKVGFQSHIDMMFLWQLDIINLESYYPLHISSLNSVSNRTIPDKINLASLNQMRNDNPQLYFYFLACRPYAALRTFHAKIKNDTVQSLQHGNLFDVSSVRARLDEDIKQGQADPSLGPVIIDLQEKNAFGRKPGSRRHFTVDTRRAWLTAMSLQMAWRRINNRNESEKKLDLPPWEEMSEDSQEQCRTALAAYYMAAFFNEDLQNIVHNLQIMPSGGPEKLPWSGIATCAAWILWAARFAHMPINDRDRAMLNHLCHDLEVEDMLR